MRKSNFELLRIISMLMIVFLHFGTHGLEKTINLDVVSGFELYLYYTLRSLSIIAVNLYILISGYFLIRKKRSDIKKIVLFVTEVGFFATFIYLSYGLYTSNPIDIKSFIGFCLSVFTNKYWFATVYFLLFLIHPYINKIIADMTQKQYFNLLAVLFSVCCIWQFFFHSNQLGVWNGYGILSFIFLYLVGGYIALFDLPFRFFRKNTYFFLYVSLSLLNAFLMYYYNVNGLNENQFLKYCNPIVFMSSLSLFMYFKEIDIKSKLINNLSKFSFGIYLVHEHPDIRSFVWKELGTIDYVINSSNHFNSWVKMFLIVGGVFFVSLILSIIISFFYSFFIKILTKIKNYIL